MLSLCSHEGGNKPRLSHVALCPFWTRSFLLPQPPLRLLGTKARDVLCYHGLQPQLQSLLGFIYLFCHLETRSLCAALANLELSMEPKLTPNSLCS